MNRGYTANDLPQPIYGSFPEKQPLFRRRINCWGALLSWLFPCILFSGLYWVLSFRVQYDHPGVASLCTLLSFAFVVCLGLVALDAWRKRLVDRESEPTWIIFMFLSCFVAWTLANILGPMNFQANMQNFYQMETLGSYWDVDPSSSRGAMYMDASKLIFTQGSHLNLSQAMGFKNDDIYCVVPIVGNTSAASAVYDFWAVGKNCCNGDKGGGFTCGAYNNPAARGGRRDMSDDDRPYYRLAVEQAEAAYNIQAVHPLFFIWTQDPTTDVQQYGRDGTNAFTSALTTFYVVQGILVFVATLLFAKIIII